MAKTPQDWGWNSKSGDVSPKIGVGISLTFVFFKQFKSWGRFGVMVGRFSMWIFSKGALSTNPSCQM